ncbi:hypothetical protein PUN28_008389 [Cardiocondyla obscurior]|uniref:Uncharacterized protein n=1 Tax=Cardiocondyla obscurior TaxID=286306 RepID=A0AAW2FZ29_9HYME
MMELHRIEHEDLEKRSGYNLPSAMPDEMDYTDYRFEIARLDSYDGWPVSFIDPKKLAAAGFFYTKEKDEVKCFACTIKLSGWEDGDDPMVEHQRWSGRCKMVRNLPCGNVPIGADPSTIPKMSKCLDTCGFYGVKYMPFSGPDRTIEPSSERNDDIEISVFWDAERNVSFKAKLCDVIGAKEPTYASYERRLQSFATWPDTRTPNKKDLAAAGFFYLSGLLPASDETMCFYCGGCLKSWEPTDEPVAEHVKWFPRCKFIQKTEAMEQLNNKLASCTSSTDQTDYEACSTSQSVTVSVSK